MYTTVFFYTAEEDMVQISICVQSSCLTCGDNDSKSLSPDVIEALGVFRQEVKKKELKQRDWIVAQSES